MKYLRSFNESTEIHLAEIRTLCYKYNITQYTINDDGSIDAHEDVYFFNKPFSKLPLTFGRVDGSFTCISTYLKTLEGAPKYVDGDFICNTNQLINLNYAPEYVNGDFDCRDNKLTSLKGISKKIKGDIKCSYNNIKNIEYLPKHYKDLYLIKNPIFNILKLFTYYNQGDVSEEILNTKENHELICYFIEREIIEEDILLIDRLVEFLEDVGKPKTKEYLYELLKKDYTIR